MLWGIGCFLLTLVLYIERRVYMETSRAAKISMVADFYILKNLGNGQFGAMFSDEIVDVSIGGFTFHSGQYRVPFDWKAYEHGWEDMGLGCEYYSFTSGIGWMFRDYELDRCYDDCYAEMGLKREDITAEFLASAHHIDDFYINFVDKDGRECEAGHWKANGDKEAPFRMWLLKVGFEDVDGEKVYEVDRKVIEAFNNGSKVIGLDGVLSVAKERVAEQGGAAHKELEIIDKGQWTIDNYGISE